MAGDDQAALRRCPKCRSVHVAWIERSEAFQYFDQTETGIDPIGWMDHGAIKGVVGLCRTCAHRWTPKGVNGRPVIMVTDLPGYPKKSS